MADGRWAMIDATVRRRHLSNEVVAAAVDCAERLKRRLPPGFDARWVPAANLHLTVRFIGQVVDERVPPLLDALKSPVSVPPFDVTLASCGIFPASGPPRVIWLGLGEGVPELRALHEEFSRRVERLGYESEKRPFAVHLTLARIKSAHRSTLRAARDQVVTCRPGLARCRVSVAIVYESRLSPQGPTYIPVIEVPCTG